MPSTSSSENSQATADSVASSLSSSQSDQRKEKRLSSESDFEGNVKRSRIEHELLLDVTDIGTFWMALCNSQYKLTPTECGNVLELPENVFILGDAELPSRMLFRQAYVDLFTIMNLPYPSTAGTAYSNAPVYQNTWIITGTPGVGKTFFSAFLLWKLSSLGTTVVYECEDLPNSSTVCYLLLPNGEVQVGRRADLPFERYLRLPETWYIVDGCPPRMRVKSKVVLVTSPRRKTYHKFRKSTDALMRYMPVWNQDELEVARRLIYHESISRQKMMDAFDMVGGVPRHIFAKSFVFAPSLDPFKRMVDLAIFRSNLSTCMQFAGESDGPDDICHQLIHYDVSDCTTDFHSGYADMRLKFASHYVREAMLTKFWEQEQQNLIRLFNQGSGVSAIQSFRGELFEVFAHRILSHGGTFECRRLIDSTSSGASADGSTVDSISIPKLDMHLLDDLLKCKSYAAQGYYRPKTRNFPVVDSVIIKDSTPMLMQVTVSGTHPLKRAKVAALVSRLNHSANRAKIFFVVPSELYESFCHQNMVTTRGDPAVRDPEGVKSLEQYVIKLDPEALHGRLPPC